MAINHQKVIVIGGSHHNTLGVIRSLGRKGIRPLVVLTSGDKSSFVLKSRYIEKGWVVKDSTAAVEFLLNNYAYDSNNKIVLIACHDVISSVLDLRRDDLSQFFIIPGSKESGEITYLMDKKRMGDLACQIGMNIPKTYVINSTNLELLENIDYPCITKPLESKSGNKGEITICKDTRDLISFFNGKSRDYIVQKYIEKQSEFQLIGCSLGEGEDIIIPGVSVILRQDKCSNTGFLHYTTLDNSYNEAVNASKALIRNIGYSGLFSVEFLRDKRAIDYFMEINFRNDGNTIAVANAGVNLPYIWYLYCIGADYKSEIVSIHDEYVMPEFAELSLFQQRQISWKQWICDMKKATSYMDYAEDDPAPTDGWKRYKKQRRTAIVKRIVKTIIGRE